MDKAKSYIYIMSSRSRTLYIGVTTDLGKRVCEHKQGKIEGFTKKYNINRLVYYEVIDAITEAIEREKQLKGWVRQKKVDLIESVNPNWDDLYQQTTSL
jgi:putative endonuclease